MPLPRVVARLNKRFTNRLIEPLVRSTKSFVVVGHVGRRSGRSYQTPINLFPCGDRYVASLTYGPDADWVRNVMAGPATCVRSGVRFEMHAPDIVTRERIWRCLPGIVRLALRMLRVHHFLLVSLSPSDTSL